MQKTNRIQPLSWLYVFPILLILGAFAAATEEKTIIERPAVDRALATLEMQEYSEELSWFASDEREGRLPGTPGSIQAGDYIASEFEKLGLKPVGDRIDGEPSYFQYLDRGGQRGLVGEHCFNLDEKPFEYEKDWSLLGGCNEVNLDGVEVVFAGYGITAPEYEYDDYERIDVLGKAVLILRYEPREKDQDARWNGARNTQYSDFRAKLTNAEKNGAVAVLFVNGPLHHNPDTDPLSGFTTRVGGSDSLPMVHVRKNIADHLLRHAGMTLEEAQTAIDDRGRPASTALLGARLKIAAKIGNITKARNVMGLLEGSDPILKDEIVVLGAHYDHLGTRGGSVYNGADDNGSGSIGVLELAEALVKGDLRPRRSILFQLYDAEEKGLIGSRYYSDHPSFPLDKTVAMINMDMISRMKDNNCSIMGTGTAAEWEEILTLAEADSPVTFNHRESAGGGSDHSSFLRKNIPVLFFFTGMHKDYHKPTDDVALCNMEGAVEILNVSLKTMLLVADRDDRLTFKKPPPSQRRQRARFGIRTEAVEGGGPGVQIAEVISGSAAEKAGLKMGDILQSIKEVAIKERQDLGTVLRTLKPGEKVKIRYRRGDEEAEVEVTLGGG